ncbi:MAG: creatininase family protein, partial [Gammaproteobacteria bacterium]
STIEPLTVALADRHLRSRRCLINVYSGPRFAQAKQAVETQGWGGHADEMETSIMLALRPELVAMSRAQGPSAPIRRGLFNRFDARAVNYSAGGANGDPAAATREKGERLLRALLEDVLAELDQLEHG